MRRIIGMCCILLGTATAFAANFPEVEPNSIKAQANAFTMAAGDTITGTTTGVVTGTASGANNTADYFKVKTAAASAAIYQYRLTITSTPASQAFVGTIRGLTQTAAVINAGTDAAFQTSSTLTTPVRFNQWYGFGAQEEIYYRVTGGAATTGTYTSTLTRTTITPVAGPTNLYSGNITITSDGQGHTTDTDMWVYDSSFNAISQFGNDDISGTNFNSSLTQSYGPGTYYLAITNFQLANNLPSDSPGEAFQDGTVLDFPNAVANSSTTTNLNLAVAFTDTQGTIQVALTKTEAYQIRWVQFTVVAPPAFGACCIAGVCNAGQSATQCSTNGGQYQGDGTNCTVDPCPQACCFTDGSCQDLSPTACTTAGGRSQGINTNCGSSDCTHGACCLTDGTCQFLTQVNCVALANDFSWASGQPCLAGGSGTFITYNYTGAAVAIPDADVTVGATAVINVPDNYPVADVNVFVNITHTFIGDLEIAVVHGTTFRFVWLDQCGGADNMAATFDDEGNVLACASPAVGPYPPNVAGDGELSIFDGLNVNGAWTLRVFDTTATDTGTLNTWSITVESGFGRCVGSCCTNTTTCTLVTAAQCATAGGNFNGLETNCQSHPCVAPTGACCRTNQACSAVTESDCNTLGGTYLGNFTTCSPDPCPRACCFPQTGTCQDTTTGNCTALGGTPQGSGSVCSSTVCPFPACTNATVINSLPFHADFDNDATTQSGPQGSCNIGSSSPMQNATWFKWTAPFNGVAVLSVDNTGLYDAIVLVTSGTCGNLAEVACGDEPEPIEVQICVTQGTTYFIQIGDWGNAEGGGQTAFDFNATAGDQGACCLPDGTCSFGTEAACTTAGGTYQGNCNPCATANCPPAGACCFANGTCQQLTSDACATAGGTHQGDNVGCFIDGGDTPFVYTSTSAPQAIPDDDLVVGVTDTITVTDNYVVVDVNLFVDIPDHTFIGDLVINLLHSTEGVTVWFLQCGASIGMAATFDDEGAVVACASPAVGPYDPSVAGLGPLSVFDQTNVNGVWTLEVFDSAAGDIGTLNSWSLTITPGDPICPQSNTEACCFTNGTCQDLAPAACTTAGGTPQGASTDCTPNPCPQPPQACCFRNGACSLLTPSACATANGIAGGSGTNCSPNNCTAICLRGDCNCDGVVNNFDIDFFVNGLIDNLASYQAAGGTVQCYNIRSCWGDINQFQGFNNFDIDPFVACILAPPPPLTSCP